MPVHNFADGHSYATTSKTSEYDGMHRFFDLMQPTHLDLHDSVGHPRHSYKTSTLRYIPLGTVQPLNLSSSCW